MPRISAVALARPVIISVASPARIAAASRRSRAWLIEQPISSADSETCCEAVTSAAELALAVAVASRIVDAIAALRTELIPRATIITPNLPEAAALLDAPIAASEAEIADQGRRLLALGCAHVLIKGGHGQGAESTDYLVSADRVIALPAPRTATRNTHGTGCTLSSAIAARLAKGDDLETAVRAAKAYISAAIAAADQLAVGHGHGPVHHFHGYY
eukprot:gene14622-19347_t